MHRTIMNMVAIASLCLMASCFVAQAQPPDATLKVHTVSIALGAGYKYLDRSFFTLPLDGGGRG